MLGKVISRVRYARYPGRLYRKDTPEAAKTYFKLASLLSYGEYRRRVELCPPSEIVIPDAKGFLIHNYSGDAAVMAAIRSAQDAAATIDWRAEQQKAKKPFLIHFPIAARGPIQELVLALLPPVARYIGSLPVLQSAEIWFSPNVENEPGRSQDFHMDSEDVRQVKCFLPLADVTSDSGPLTLLPADVTDRVYRTLVRERFVSKRNIKLADQVIERLFESVEKVEVVGQPGTVGFVDTCRCYHYGSRKAAQPRLLMVLHFQSAFSMEMPVWGRRYEPHELGELGTYVFGARQLMFPNVRAARRKAPKT
jgi:hypothetical protein